MFCVFFSAPTGIASVLEGGERIKLRVALLRLVKPSRLHAVKCLVLLGGFFFIFPSQESSEHRTIRSSSDTSAS